MAEIFNQNYQEYIKLSPPSTPIDGGLSLLLAGEAVYGIKKLKDMKKQ